MKFIIVATFVIIAASSMIKCEAKAFFFFPFRFDYKEDKTNDGAAKTLVYSSPFSGKTYNLEYHDNWPSVTLPPLPPPPKINWDIKWNFSKDSASKSVVVNKETTAKPSESTTVLPKSGSYSGQVGHKTIDVKWSFDSGSATTPSSQTSSSEKPIKDDENEQVSEDDSSKTETIHHEDDGEAQDNDIDPTSNDR